MEKKTNDTPVTPSPAGDDYNIYNIEEKIRDLREYTAFEPGLDLFNNIFKLCETNSNYKSLEDIVEAIKKDDIEGRRLAEILIAHLVLCNDVRVAMLKNIGGVSGLKRGDTKLFEHIKKTVSSIYKVLDAARPQKKAEDDGVRWNESDLADLIKTRITEQFINQRNGRSVDTYVYNPDTGVWEENKGFTLFELVRANINNIVEEERRTTTEDPKDFEMSKERPFKSLRAINAITSIIERANTQTGVVFDENKDLLNTPANVYDLRQHRAIPHDAELKLSRITNMNCPELDELLPAPVFDGILEHMFEGDATMIEYVLEMIGASLLRVAYTENTHIVNGKTAQNGKTTLFLIICEVLNMAENGYADWLDSNAFSNDRIHNATQPELVNAFGKCLAVVDEPDAQTISTNMMKLAANKGKISLRTLWETTKTRDWTATVVYLCNRLPVMDLSDAGAIRRIRVIPVETQINKEFRDTQHIYDNGKNQPFYKYIALNEGSAILQRIVAALKRFEERGCEEHPLPKKVEEATKQYLIDRNIVMSFIDDLCTKDPLPGEDVAYTNAKNLYTIFKSYCLHTLDVDDKFIPTKANFRERLAAFGIKYPYWPPNNKERCFKGIRPKTKIDTETGDELKTLETATANTAAKAIMSREREE